MRHKKQKIKNDSLPMPQVLRISQYQSKKQHYGKTRKQVKPLDINHISRNDQTNIQKSINYKNNSILPILTTDYHNDELNQGFSNEKLFERSEMITFSDNISELSGNSWYNNGSNKNLQENNNNSRKLSIIINPKREYSRENTKKSNIQMNEIHSEPTISTNKTDTNSKMKNRQKQKHLKNGRCPCSCLYIFIFSLAALLIGTIIIAVTFALLTQHTTTTTTTTTTTRTSNCTPSCLNGGTCIANNTCLCINDVWTGSYCQTPVRILWKFDNNLQDFYSNYPGVGLNNPTYHSPGINGYGTCLYLNSTFNQSVIIYTPPFLNMAYTSFSLVAWVYATSFRNSSISGSSSDNAIFGQFDNNTLDHSLHIIVRNHKIYLGFFGDDIQGNITLYSDQWYHMAYIYDYANLTQYVYVNGILDVSGSPKGPYKGSKGDLTIGTNGVNFPNNYWNGYVDQIAYFSRAKTATEVLRDATLTVSYNFDNNLLDNGPLGINGTGENYQYSTSGRVNQCLDLSNNQSYVHATGLVLLGTSSQSYSFSIWIKPIVVTHGTIIHISQFTSGYGSCLSFLGFTNTSAISVQSWNSTIVSITGPTVTSNVWTHIAITYSLLNGLHLWINGTQYGSGVSAFKFISAGVTVITTLGSSLNGTYNCTTKVIQMGQYIGYIDEFALYSRELSSTDIFNLANP